jgi:diguanylate cyclase (GGDEF)-like protein
VCVPVSTGGRAIGVLHTTTAIEHPSSPTAVARLEAVAAHSGSRIGMLRVMEATHLQAATDPLTGLLNRRSFENRAHSLLRGGTPFALAMGDLDHFKRLNDTHGHDAGDRALRAFSQTMRAALRDDDLICRFGGEEFVILFPRRTAIEAARALARVQEELLVSVARGTTPAFTVSFGVAQSDQSSELDELCRIADAALFRAKREGRNRVVVDSLGHDNAEAISFEAEQSPAR